MSVQPPSEGDQPVPARPDRTWTFIGAVVVSVALGVTGLMVLAGNGGSIAVSSNTLNVTVSVNAPK